MPGTRRLSHEGAAACSRGRQPAVRVESSGKSHEVATASVVVACYRHFVANPNLKRQKQPKKRPEKDLASCGQLLSILGFGGVIPSWK